jgi:hypothetical protein
MEDGGWREDGGNLKDTFKNIDDSVVLGLSKNGNAHFVISGHEGSKRGNVGTLVVRFFFELHGDGGGGVGGKDGYLRESKNEGEGKGEEGREKRKVGRRGEKGGRREADGKGSTLIFSGATSTGFSPEETATSNSVGTPAIGDSTPFP